MYRAPEMVDLYLRDVLTEQTDIWVSLCYFVSVHFHLMYFCTGFGLHLICTHISDASFPRRWQFGHP
jgi:hypothetical protein